MICEAVYGDLSALLYLYTHLHGNPIPKTDEKLMSLWQEIMNDKHHHVIVAKENEKIVSSCVLVIVPNLTHGQRPYGFIENVVTDEGYRKRGFASGCLAYAKEIAENESCYKLMLMTGSKEESTLAFYERAGYNKTDKTAFVQWL